MAQRNYGGVYANMNFPHYEFQEYPKHVITGSKGQFVVVNNKKEEDELRAKLASIAPEIITEDAMVDPEKELLFGRAKELGVPFNRMWSKTKLQKVIDEAELSFDNLPAEGEIPGGTFLAKYPEAPSPDADPTVEVDEDALKLELIAQAKALGINATRLWGIPKIRAAIAEVQEA